MVALTPASTTGDRVRSGTPMLAKRKVSRRQDDRVGGDRAGGVAPNEKSEPGLAREPAESVDHEDWGWNADRRSDGPFFERRAAVEADISGP